MVAGECGVDPGLGLHVLQEWVKYMTNSVQYLDVIEVCLIKLRVFTVGTTPMVPLHQAN